MRNTKRFQLFLTFVLYMIYTIQLHIVSTCPLQCTCSGFPLEVYCNRKNLTSIPTDLPGNAYIISLNRNNISTIATDTFVGLHQLYWLDILWSKLKQIEAGAFKDLPSLEQMHLSYNEISEIGEKAFQNLSQLSILNLGNNKISVLQPNTFSNLIHLKTLILSNNLFTDIKQDYFNGLPFIEEIRLHRNNVTYLEENAFKAMPNLIKLALDLYCDCSIIPFWNWLKLVGKYAKFIRCFDRNRDLLSSLPSCAFDKCNGTDCPSYFCTNGGTCYVNNFGEPSCNCTGDWTGAKCDVNPCHNDPCGNNGDCEVNVNQHAICHCHGAWTGQFCERSPCETKECYHSVCYYNDTGAALCLNLKDTQCTENNNTAEH